ncbi:SHOCT domain-containing protein [Kocuria sp. M1R5S2]|uniref:SHOCT domain-containing protein n=1 Tax=Kocuria rhizosphaerae TaxID=3376285 RepID=UPI0037B371A0
MMWDGGWGGMGWMWVFWILVVLGTTLLVVVLVKLAGPGGTGRGGPVPPGTGPGRAREILEERYARGEISTEEFRERLRTLEESGR